MFTADDGGVGTNSLLLTGFGRSGTFFVDVGSIGSAPESVAWLGPGYQPGTYRVTLIGNAPPVLSPDAGSPHQSDRIVRNHELSDTGPSFRHAVIHRSRCR